MAQKEFNLSNSVAEDLVKVTLNTHGDYMLINASDAGFTKKYGELLKWLEDKETEMAKEQKEFMDTYGEKEIISQNEYGEVIVCTEPLMKIASLWTNLYKETADRIERIFGQDCLKKYFRDFYDITPDFVPDEECIVDFLENISPVMGYAYTARAKRLDSKYNKNRRGRRKNV